ncbi:thioredoxin fold domain-containing protein [Sutterella sp.]|uniref:thioredoxin fold domain-containing protein n=1 Tax=Sutterella sp. TaxID=1981025 RepID=UPI003FD8CDB2
MCKTFQRTLLSAAAMTLFSAAFLSPLAASNALAADAPAAATQPAAKGSIEAFQQKVNAIAAKNGVAAPDVKKELAGQAKKESREENPEDAAMRRALSEVPPIERVVAIDANVIRAIKNKEGRIMFLVDNGRFAFVGKMIDVWNRKELSTIEDIADAVSHIDLDRMGFKLDRVNHITVGSGAKQVVAFVDPQCGWCHKLMDEINDKPELMKNYTFNFVVVPVLGERSNTLSKRLFCAKTTDQQAKYQALVSGARAIEKLDQKDDCDLEIFNQTRTVANAIGVQGVPFIISDDGRFERGKPRDLMAFLDPDADAAAKAAAQLSAAPQKK